jgi:hypothetical protein
MAVGRLAVPLSTLLARGAHPWAWIDPGGDDDPVLPGYWMTKSVK